MFCFFLFVLPLTKDKYRILINYRGRRVIGISGSLIWSKTLMELKFNPCGEFWWSPEGPISQTQSPHLHAGAPGIFSDLSRSVQMQKRERESGVRKATGNYRTYSSLVKLQPWFLSLRWEICLWAELQPWYLSLQWKFCPWAEHSWWWCVLIFMELKGGFAERRKMKQRRGPADHALKNTHWSITYYLSFMFDHLHISQNQIPIFNNVLLECFLTFFHNNSWVQSFWRRWHLYVQVHFVKTHFKVVYQRYILCSSLRYWTMQSNSIWKRRSLWAGIQWKSPALCFVICMKTMLARWSPSDYALLTKLHE